MGALVLEEAERPLVWVDDHSVPRPRENEVLVSIRAAALNRRDVWITRGLYPGIELPAVLGSDGAGLVTRVGRSVTRAEPGDEVIIDPALDWGPNDAVPGREFRVLGMPDDGTLATEIVVPEANVHKKPAYLSWPEAAALPLAGVTAYRALFTRGGLRTAERVLVTGIGGGVATFALQLALTAQAEVWVTSSSSDKIDRAIALGAKGGALYTEEDWPRRLELGERKIDVIVDGAGGSGHGALVDLAAPGARIVSYGATAGAPPPLHLFKLFWRQLSVLGSTLGSPIDFLALLRLARVHEFRPVIDSEYPLVDGNRAFERMATPDRFGKVVLLAPESS